MFKSRMFVLFLAGILLAGCGLRTITGSGNVVTQAENISGFDRVEVDRAFKVNIRQGETYSVIVRIDDNLVEYLQVVKEGNTLKIGLKTDRTIRNSTQEAEVTMPELAGLDLSGASHGTITGFKSTNSLDVGLHGASSLKGDVEAGDARFDAQGASEAALSGSGQNITVVAEGGSTVDLSKFSAADANVSASGSSNVTVNASGTLDAVAKGSATVYYLGSPTLGTIETSGSAEVREK